MAKARDEPGVPWSAAEDLDLAAAIEEHGAGNWATGSSVTRSLLSSNSLDPPLSLPRTVSLALENTRTPAQCYHRYTQSLKSTIKRGSWSLDEDERLREAVTLHGQKWSKVKDLLPGRTAAQCRERYVRAAAYQKGSSVGKTGSWSLEVSVRRKRYPVSFTGYGKFNSLFSGGCVVEESEGCAED